MASTATLVILLANLIMVLRVLAIAWACRLRWSACWCRAACWRCSSARGGDRPRLAPDGQPGRAAGSPDPQPHRTRAPPSASAALRRVLLCAAWLSDIAGRGGCTCWPSPRASPTWTRSPCPAPLQPGKLEGLAAIPILPGDARQPGLQVDLRSPCSAAPSWRRGWWWACSPSAQASPGNHLVAQYIPIMKHSLAPSGKGNHGSSLQRLPAVAGLFYPADPHSLHAQIAGFLAAAVPGEVVPAPRRWSSPRRLHLPPGAVAPAPTPNSPAAAT